MSKSHGNSMSRTNTYNSVCSCVFTLTSQVGRNVISVYIHSLHEYIYTETRQHRCLIIMLQCSFNRGRLSFSCQFHSRTYLEDDNSEYSWDHWHGPTLSQDWCVASLMVSRVAYDL